MYAKSPLIVLNTETREQLERLTRSRSQPLRLIQRSRIVLLAAAVGQRRDWRGIEHLASESWALAQPISERGMDGILKENLAEGVLPLLATQARCYRAHDVGAKPANATQWSQRRCLLKRLSPSTVGRI